MSYDLNIGTGAVPLDCDHKVSRERYVLSSDWRTLSLLSDITMHMRAPINSRDLIQVFIGGQLVKVTDEQYGYSVLRDLEMESVVKDLVSGELFYKIQFNKPVRLGKQLIEVTYFTFQDFCSKCAALGKVADLQPVASGSFSRITGSDKLIQKVLKWLLTSRCSFYPNYTCPLKGFIGKKSLAGTADIQQAITSSMTRLQNVQAQQSTVQSLDASEVLTGVSAVSVTNDSDPRLTNVSISISSQKGAATPVSFAIKS